MQQRAETAVACGSGLNEYAEFAPAVTDRAAIRQLVESDAGVQARVQAVRDALAGWWSAHATRLAQLPKRRDLNAVRTEFLDTFTQALLPLGVLGRFKLAGVVATWWTDTLPDFKTLLEQGFPGVIDGWIDAIADAVEDDDNVGPAFNPFAHKLVRRTMTDYLEQINSAKSDIARLKSEKEAFEQSNPSDDADEDELAAWNYAKDLERQIRELKAEHKDALKALAKLEKAAAKQKASDVDRKAADDARAALQPVFDQIAALEAELVPYEQTKTDLAAARARYRELTNAFVDELKRRCAAFSADEEQSLVLELIAQDVHTGLDGAVDEKRQNQIRFLENLWDKYAVALVNLGNDRAKAQSRLHECLQELGYA